MIFYSGFLQSCFLLCSAWLPTTDADQKLKSDCRFGRRELVFVTVEGGTRSTGNIEEVGNDCIGGGKLWAYYEDNA